MSAATKAFKERALVTLENLSPDNVEGFYYPAFIGGGRPVQNTVFARGVLDSIDAIGTQHANIRRGGHQGHVLTNNNVSLTL
jgi:hypothetical protein